jgi:hypothetical protein
MIILAPLAALPGMAFPRFVLLATWLFTSRVAVAFHHGLFLPLLGLLFLPCTTLMFVLACAPGSGVRGIGWLVVVLGFLVDLGSHGGARSAKNRHAETDRIEDRRPTADR